jgi:transaldolase
MHAFADHGVTKADAVTSSYAAAHKVLDDLAGIGVDYDDVVDTLEREAVEKFEASWTELLGSVEGQLGVKS